MVRQTRKTSPVSRLARSERELDWEEKPARKSTLAVKVAKRPIRKAEDYPSAREVIDKARLEREKKLIMWSGVAFFMLLISGFWFVNMKNSFLRVSSQADAGTEDFQAFWQSASADLSERFQELEAQMPLLPEEAGTEAAGAGAETETETSGEAGEIEALKQALEEMPALESE